MPTEEVRRLHGEGKGSGAIAEALGVSRMSVWRALKPVSVCGHWRARRPGAPFHSTPYFGPGTCFFSPGCVALEEQHLADER